MSIFNIDNIGEKIEAYKTRFIAQYGQEAWDVMMAKNRQQAEIRMREFLSDGRGAIAIPDYVMELKRYADDMSFKLFKSKVNRVCNRCLRLGKYNLASKIYAKYPTCFVTDSDLAIAFGYALKATKK